MAECDFAHTDRLGGRYARPTHIRTVLQANGGGMTSRRGNKLIGDSQGGHGHAVRCVYEGVWRTTDHINKVVHGAGLGIPLLVRAIVSADVLSASF